MEERFFSTWLRLFPNLPKPDRQHQPFLHIGRKHAWDFSWLIPEARVMLAVEIQGRGRHNTITGQAKDYEKCNLAVREGWQVLYFNSINLKDIEDCVSFTAEVLCKARDV